jgi:TorA maturation chaperone TorD
MIKAELALWLQAAGAAFLNPDAVFLRPHVEALLDTAWDEEARELLASIQGSPLDLERDYVRLFLSPTGPRLSLWQSAREDPPRLMGQAHRSAVAWYTARGIQPRAKEDPADHVGLLLSFGAHLLESNDSDFAEYHFQHLAWIPGFCDAVAASATHPFLARLAAITPRLLTDCQPLPLPSTES